MRPIDADALITSVAWHDQQGMISTIDDILDIIDAFPTLTPPNEQMLERVAREYFEICGEDCVGNPSVGIPECPFFQYADVLDNGALIQPKCELAAYRRPPEGEENT